MEARQRKRRAARAASDSAGLAIVTSARDRRTGAPVSRAVYARAVLASFDAPTPLARVLLVADSGAKG
jgi:hypothetical protein